MSEVDSLPAIPTVPGEEVTGDAVVVLVGERRLLALPFRAGFGRSRGRRYRITGSDGRRTASQVVLVIGGRAMLPFAGDGEVGDAVRLTVRCMSQRPHLRVPRDLRAALDEAGLDVGVMPEQEATQFITMVQEADDPSVRAHRIQATLTAVRARTQSIGEGR